MGPRSPIEREKKRQGLFQTSRKASAQAFPHFLSRQLSKHNFCKGYLRNAVTELGAQLGWLFGRYVLLKWGRGYLIA